MLSKNRDFMNNSISKLPLLLLLVYSSILGAQNPCPFVVDPVCGSNGITYMNGCYAEAAGITDYTPGVCFSDCIDPAQMNPNANCNQNFEPVCGCNEVTYINACVAEANGVTNYKQGACNTSDDCYDPVLVVTSNGTVLNYPEGTIDLVCDLTPDPVCACNGLTYLNPCVAEASGITFYTFGACNTNCIVPDQMDPNADCPDAYDPVCGCNNITYSNACEAEAAGLTSYQPGPCGENTTWCQEASPINCGDYLSNESNAGAGNQITNYPGCTGTLNYNGPDKVYVINKTTVGDLQIGMEITSPNTDLDLFLLADACDQLRCLASSTQNNNQTNTENILFENAPLGIYYLVVDGRNATAFGNYRLELNCGYLKCADALPLTCGEPFPYSNLLGSDNVSIYSCQDDLNGENNGPEVIHQFTQTADGPIEITLSELSANLELFLLASCDRNDCLEFSQNPGTADESIVTFLNAGTYYVIVDGNNGATSDYTLQINCDSPCDLAFSNVASSSAVCGQSNGAITLNTTGGTGPYTVSWSGPSTGSLMTTNTSTLITGLPAGFYTIGVRDAMGCFQSNNITVNSNSNFAANITATAAICSQDGSLQFSLTNGNPTYQINLVGPVSTMLSAGSNQFSIDNLSPGDYLIYITDANGCLLTESVQIDNDNSSFSFTTSSQSALCNQSGNIAVSVQSGQGQYMVQLTGPVNRMFSTSLSNFTIDNLPGGNYNLQISDANNCSQSQMISVEEENVMINLSPISGACGQTGSLILDISGSASNYTISYSGPVSGNISSGNTTYLIADLPVGSYSFQVSGDNGCSDFETTTVSTSEGELETDIIPIHSTCGQSGAFWLDFENGSPNYTITWTGPVNGSTSTSNAGLDIPNIPEGEYIIEIIDNNGCTNVHQVEIEGTNNLSITALEQEADCGQGGFTSLNINDGQPPYVIVWNGPEAGYAVTDENYFLMPEMESGQYALDITDSEGCNTSLNISINNAGAENEELTVSSSALQANCANIGAILLDIEGGQANYNISWTGPSSGTLNSATGTITLDNLPAGSYTIIVTDANGCDKTQNLYIPEAEDESLSMGGHPLMAGCNDLGAILVEIEDGSGNYQITWSGPESGSITTSDVAYIIRDLPVGNYLVEVEDANGCSGQNNYEIYAQEESDLDFTVNTNFTSCQSDGIISVYITGGNPNYMIMWEGAAMGMASTGNNNFHIPNAPAGTYTITITDGTDCIQTQTITATSEDNDLSLSLSQINTACNEDNGGIDLHIEGGQSSYNIRWTGPNSGNITTNNSNYNISGLAAGTYTVLVIDANGCSITDQVQVETQGGALDVEANLIAGFCGTPGSIELIFNDGTPGYQISWTGPSSGTAATSSSNYTIPDLASGLYMVDIEDANGCSTLEEVVVNNSATSFTLQLEAFPSACSQEGAIRVNVVGGSPGFAIEWTGPESGSVLTTNSAYVIPDLSIGTYNVRVQDNGGCIENKQIVLESSPDIFDITLIPNPGACGEEGSITVEIENGVPDYSVSWVGPENGSISTNLESYEIINLSSGTYVIAVTDASGCVDQRAATLINPEGEGIELDLTPINGACGSEGSIWIDIIGGSGNYTLSWSGPESGSVNVQGDGYNIPGLADGTYTIEIEDELGCGGSGLINLASAEADLSMELTPINGACGSEGSIWIDIFGGQANYLISWSGPESGSTTISDDGYNIPGLPAGVYSVTISDANNCSTTQNINVLINEADLSVNISPNTAVCNGMGSISLQMSGGNPNYAITWFGLENGAITTSNENYTITDLLAGTYVIIISDANNCTTTEMITLHAAEGEMSVEGNALHGGCGSLGAIALDILDGSADYFISWSGPVSGSIEINEMDYTIRDLPSGSYQIVVRDENGCLDEINITLDNELGQTEFTLTTIDGDCESDPDIMIDIEGGYPTYSISWSGPENGAVETNNSSYMISDLEAGTYQIQVVDASACAATPIEVTVEAVENDLSATIVPFPSTCGTPGSIDVQITGGEAPYIISWTGPSSGALTTMHELYNIPQLASGDYTVVISDNKGCTVIDQTNIDNGTDSPLDVSVMVLTGDCGGLGSLWIDFYGGNPTFFITWEGPVSGSTTTGEYIHDVLNLPSGEYTLIIQDISGCEYSEVFQIENPVNDIELELTAHNGGCGEQGAVQVDISGGTALYTINWTGAMSGEKITYEQSDWIEGLNSGTYLIEVTDIFGCSQVAEIDIQNEVGTFPTANYSYTVDDMTVSFINTASEGTYTWDFGDGNSSEAEHPTHEYLLSDTYTVCLSVENNCGVDTYCEEIEVVTVGGLTDTEEYAEISSVKLWQNEPNPFRDRTTIRFETLKAMELDLIVHNELGSVVHQITVDAQAGQNELSFSGKALAPGVYFYTLRGSDFSLTKKMLIIR